VPVDTRALVALSDLAARRPSADAPTPPDRGPRVQRSRALGRRRVTGLAVASVGAGLVCGLVVPADAAVPSRPTAEIRHTGTTTAPPAVLLGATPSPFATVTRTRTAAAKPVAAPKAAPKAAPEVAPKAAPQAASTAVPKAAALKPAAAAKAAVATRPGSGARAPIVADPRPPRAGALRTPRGAASAAVVAGGSTAYVPTRPLPARSGAGRRIVYSERAAHLWVVGDDGTVLRDYPVTGRVGRPKPGTYHVYSKSTIAINPGQKLRFEYMVRFAVGVTGARIGFHTIPRYYDGVPIQKESQLGRAIGAGGCVRQSRADAVWLYGWSRVGDTVVVRL
jgi:hypothetical protein